MRLPRLWKRDQFREGVGRPMFGHPIFGHYTKISLKEIFEGCLEYRTKAYMADTRECTAIKNNSTIIDYTHRPGSVPPPL